MAAYRVVAIIHHNYVHVCRDIFCAGRVVDEDLRRTMKACGGAIQTSVNGLTDSVLGTCEAFQEEQIGGDRYKKYCIAIAALICTPIDR